jgi:hypothetical protein
MANLTIKPASVTDTFTFTDANATPNTILTVEGQTEGGVAANLLGGRIIYGKGVNETLGTSSQTGTVITIDLATGTFFEHQLTEAATTWKILHLPAAGTIAAWVVKLQQKSSPAVLNTWTGNAASTYDNGADPIVWTAITPVFHWGGGTAHIMTTTVSAYDVVSFWTKGGSPSVIYSSVSALDTKAV